MTFPLNPTDGQVHTTVGGTVYTYNTAKGAWYIQSSSTIVGPPPPAGTLLPATAAEILAGTTTVKYISPKGLADVSTDNPGGLADANKLVKLNNLGKLNTSSLPNDIMEYRGRVPPTSVAPAAPSIGNVYVMSADGVADASWVGVGGTPLKAAQMVIWDGSVWVSAGGGGSTAVPDTFSSPLGTIVNTGADGSNLVLDVSMAGLASAAQASTLAENAAVTGATTVLTNIGGTIKEVPVSVITGTAADTFVSTGGTIVNLGSSASNLNLDVDHNALFNRPAVASAGEILSLTGNDEVWIQVAGGVRQVKLTDMFGVMPPDVYLDTLGFNSGNGELTATLTDATTVKVDLDGRYVQTLNAVAPDAVGNVPLSLTAVATGTELARPATPADATIYVVSNNTTDPTKNGKTFIYQTASSQWYEIVGYDVASMDARYINNAGDTMLGQLILNADPTVALGAATKQYVDNLPRVTSVAAGTGLTGGTITSTGVIALAASGATAGTYGSASMIPTITVDIYGRISSVSATAVAAAWGAVTGKPTTLAGYGITDSVADTRSINTSGSLTGGGNLSADRTIGLVNDSAAPGNSFYYGTNSTGVKGYHALPAGSAAAVAADVLAGTDAAKSVTSKALADAATVISAGAADVNKYVRLGATGKLDPSVMPASGSTPIATGAEVITGTDNAKTVTALALAGASVVTSAGAADAGKLVKLDAAGLVDDTVVPKASNAAVLSGSAVDAFITPAGLGASSAAVSAGAADAGKLVKFNAAGKIDATAFPTNLYVPLAGTAGVTGAAMDAGAVITLNPTATGNTVLNGATGANYGALDKFIIDCGTF